MLYLLYIYIITLNEQLFVFMMHDSLAFAVSQDTIEAEVVISLND